LSRSTDARNHKAGEIDADRKEVVVNLSLRKSFLPLPDHGDALLTRCVLCAGPRGAPRSGKRREREKYRHRERERDVDLGVGIDSAFHFFFFDLFSL